MNSSYSMAKDVARIKAARHARTGLDYSALELKLEGVNVWADVEDAIEQAIKKPSALADFTFWLRTPAV